jgi:flagellar protein FlaG
MNVSPLSQGISAPASHAAGVNPGAPAVSGGPASAVASSPPIFTAVSAAEPRNEQLKQAMSAVNKFIEPAGNIEFQIDEQSGRTVMRLVDKETGSVLRQLPSEEMLALARALDKLSGLVIKLKV